MQIPLPPIEKDKMLPIPHFPTAYQCVIFRNWGLVPVSKIADVIETDSDTVRLAAVEMGLDPDPEVLDAWLTKGYITVIRANWHILDYPALCRLLDWTPEKLAFILKEDDFLDIKLGRFKPGTKDYRYRKLSDEEKEQTENIRKIIKEAKKSLPDMTAKPFDFCPMFTLRGEKTVTDETPRFEERYCYSYCALYGDTFLDKNLIDESFPDELLSAYRNAGITGVWTHIILYTVVEFPFDKSFSTGFEERQKGMRYLTEKLAKYGLKLFLYFNEPRAMPMSFYEKNPHLLGWEKAGFGSLCLGVDCVREYLKNGVAELVRNVPLLGGFFTITASENFTNCHSHGRGYKDCPRCANTLPAETFALVNNLVLEGARSVSDSVKVIAWSWGWDEEIMPDVIEKLSPGISVMGVSEQRVHKDIDGTDTSVLDYSLSIEGPGEYALSTWAYAHKNNHKGYAKMQVNNTWELAAVPYIPVFEKPYRHIKRLIEAGENCPDGLMLSWSLGGYPSPTFEMFSKCYGGTVPAPQELYKSIFPELPSDEIAEVFHIFSEAFDLFPFNIDTAYNGPQHYSPANLFYSEPTGFRSTMVGYPYDNLDGWRNIFPAKTYVSRLKRLSDMWNAGFEKMKTVYAKCEITPKLRELYDCAEVCTYHFRSMYLQCAFIVLRDGLDVDVDITAEQILREEEEIALRVASVAAHNPTIGYESSNHYFYTVNSLLEKVLNCRFIAQKLRDKN